MNEKMLYIFKRVCDEYDGAKLGKKASQKLFYFFEREGVDLRLRYGIHYYGPYSQKLSDFIDELEFEGTIEIDDSEKTHTIKWIGERPEKNICTKEEDEKISDVLKKYGHKTPLDLEALSTMDFVANTILKGKGNKNEVLENFLKIKGKKFSSMDARRFYSELFENLSVH